MFDPPVYNLVCDVWIDGPTRASGTTPDFVGLPCQLYFQQNSAPGTIYWGDPSGAVPLLVLRTPYLQPGCLTYRSFNDVAQQMFFTVYTPGDNDYADYVKWFGEVAHKGFPNAYWMFALLQCYDNGDRWVGNWWA